MKIETGMVAVITGGASGIGLALARRLSLRGLYLAIGDVEQAALDRLAAELPAERVELRKTDVSRLEDVEALRDAALARFGKIDLVFNNAGVFTRFAPMWEVGLAEWKWVLDVNLWGVIHGIKAFVPCLIAQGRGHIINTASFAGLVSLPGNAPYNAAKHAVVTLSEGLKAEFADAGHPIGVTVVCPGLVATRIRDAARNGPAELAGQLKHISQSSTARDSSASSDISAEEMAEKIVAAVEAHRLYCASHPGMTSLIEERIKPLLEQMAIY